MKLSRMYHTARLFMIRSYAKRAAYLKKHNLLGAIGENCKWGARVPLYSELIKVHNNVTVHKSVAIMTHDMVNGFLKKVRPDVDFGARERIGCIEIMDNVYIGIGAMIMPDVRINKNCFVSAGSVVTSDVPENSVVAGNPAKVIGRFDLFVASRAMNKEHNVPFKNQALTPERAAAEWEYFESIRKETAEQNTSAASTVKVSIPTDDTAFKSVRDKVVKTLSDNISGVDFETTQNLVTNNIFDSLSLITVVNLLEEEFSCKIPFQKVNPENFNSADSMTAMILSLGGGEAADETKTSVISKEDILGETIKYDEAETYKPIVQRIFEHALEEPDDTAIIVDDKTTTYGDLSDIIYSICKWLISKGVKKGDHVVVQASHEVTCPACWYAVHLAGGVMVPVEKSAPESRILEIARETQSSFIIALNSNKTSDIPWASFEDVYAIERKYKFTDDTVVEYPDIDLPCEIIFTTGTTGKSKGVLFTHRQKSLYVSIVAQNNKIRKGNRYLLTAPLNHVGGIRGIHVPLANSGSVVLMEGMSDLAKFFSAIEKHHVTALFLPPASIRILIYRTGDEFAKFKDQIDFITTSSAPLFESDCNGIKKLLPDSRLYNSYQSSEVPGGTSYNYNEVDFRPNCVGKPIKGVEVALLTEDGKLTAEAGVEGQICAKSDMTMKEYYNEPELTKSVYHDGWFVSSDIGTFDKDGYLYYVGRKDDVINIGGYKIAPTDVENLALQSGLIQECICIEDTDEYDVAYIKLLVIVEDKEKFDPAQLNTYLSERLEKYKIPRTIEAVDELKKTFNGKIDRKAYRKKK